MSTPFEEEALAVLRVAAREVRTHGYPEGIHFRYRLAEIIREAVQAGRERAALAIAEAYELQLDDGGEILADTIDGELPPGFAVRRPVVTEHRTPA